VIASERRRPDRMVSSGDSHDTTPQATIPV
jgi:hypothetical protein